MNHTVKGRITKCVGGLYSVRLADSDIPEGGDNTLKCRARGVFRHEKITPLVGDNVVLRIENDSPDGIFIDGIDTRRNSLIRPPLANLDYLFITVAAASPAPQLLTVDKLTAIAEHNAVEPVIVVTKADLDREMTKTLFDIYKKATVPVFALSSLTGDGRNELSEFIESNMPSRCAAFAGVSGAGKSTLMNMLFPSLSLVTGGVSRKTLRGKNTTREAELFEIPLRGGVGYIADTPGFSLIDVERYDFLDIETLANDFREFEPYIGKCRYTKCTHLCEEGCGITAATAEGIIPKSRHESYVALYASEKKKKKYK